MFPVSNAANAARATINGAHIVRTLAADRFGGCMAMLDVNIPATTSLNCAISWLSLDCDAVYHTQAQSNALWTSALTAFTLQTRVSLVIDDADKYGQYCVVERIDIYR